MIPFLDESGLAAIYAGAWARVIEAWKAPIPLMNAAAIPDTQAAIAGPNRRPSEAAPGIAFVPIQGVITKNAGFFADLFGGTSIDGLRAQIAELRADRSIRAVVLMVDSPGGGVHGVDEAAQAIGELAKSKPVVAFTDGMAASAAYWLIAHATAIVAAPSAEVGSIGVYAIHLDHSGAMAKEGVAPTLVKAGTHKAEGNPFFPLSDEDRAAMQSRIDGYYALFTKRIAQGRGVPIDKVRSGFGEGRIVSAREALREGMVTEIGGLQDAIRLALEPEGAAASIGAQAGRAAAAMATLTTEARRRAEMETMRVRIAIEEVTANGYGG